MMTARQWELRLGNEYEELCRIPFNTLFSWKRADSQWPPRQYIVDYHVTTMVKDPSGHLVKQDKTTVTITMPSAPNATPKASVIKGQVPYNPNIYSSGDFCLGNLWAREPHLWKLVINIGRVLAFDPARVDPNSPANPLAAADWKQKQSRRNPPYPCGRTEFPHPKR